MNSKILLSVLCLTLLTSALPLIGNDHNEIQIYLSEVEVQEIFDNPTRAYVYIGKEVSAIPHVIAEISAIENNQESLVWALADHISKGFVVGNYEAVLQSLEQAEVALHNHADTLDKEKALYLSSSLHEILEQVKANNLTLNAEMLAFLKNTVVAENNDVTLAPQDAPQI